jgi:predicted lipoprotein with Yx(FWY)xxD motif
MSRLLIVPVAALALVLPGCGDDEEDPASSGDDTAEVASTPEATVEPATEAEAPAKPGTRIKLGDSQFGDILFDSDDQAIYLFEKEQGSKSECYGECAVAWPPVLTEGAPEAAEGIKQGLLGTTERKDGTTQVTYNGHPLYYYEDEGPGEVLCHNIDEFGALWKVLDGAGEPLA